MTDFPSIELSGTSPQNVVVPGHRADRSGPGAAAGTSPGPVGGERVTGHRGIRRRVWAGTPCSQVVSIVHSVVSFRPSFSRLVSTIDRTYMAEQYVLVLT